MGTRCWKCLILWDWRWGSLHFSTILRNGRSAQIQRRWRWKCGCILANVIFNPIAKKLRIRQDEEELYCSTIIEGIIAIQAGENPKYLREHLLASIKQSQQQKILAKTEGGDSQGKEQEDK